MIEEREGPESCNTYNMLKLTKELFATAAECKYADYYERALFNHILSTQHPQHGGYVYFTPARPQHYRVYSAPNQAMWCCVGTGMENHSKYGEFIYSHDGAKTLWVNLFIASTLKWSENNVQITQNCTFPDEPKISLLVHCQKPAKFALKVRHPIWAKSGYSVSVNGQAIHDDSKPGTYASVERTWNDGDRAEVHMPMAFSVESAPGVNNYVSILYGPILLAARTDTDNLDGLVADDGRWTHIAQGALRPLDSAPMLVARKEDIGKNIRRSPDDKPLHFTASSIILPDKFKGLILEPFYQLHDARYMMYWNLTSPAEYEKRLAEIKLQEALVLKLDRATIDRVVPGEQQPEADHFMKHIGSEAGSFQNKSYRHALSPGWFSYQMKVAPERPLKLHVGYWGNEQGRRTFDILIDDRKLATENIVTRWSTQQFQSAAYAIPADMIKGKKTVTITFRPKEGNYAGGIFDLRIISD